MSELYVWKCKNIPIQKAEIKFRKILQNQIKLLSNVYDVKNISLNVRLVGESILIGLLNLDNGILNWSPWIQEKYFGSAWIGISEKHFGLALDSSKHSALFDKVEKDKCLISECADGSFLFAIWDEANKKVYVISSVLQCPTFWHTNGPYGYALGSKSFPIIALTGGTPRLDKNTAGLYLSFGYLISNSSLFENVTRVSGSQKIEIASEIKVTNYLTIQDVLKSANFDPLNFGSVVDECASRIRKRVSVQINNSNNPVLLLTAGRDSRCIAAAIKNAGKKVNTSTGGVSNSNDVIGAARVAKVLGFKHSYDNMAVTNYDRLISLGVSIHKAVMWSKLHEGVETIRHGVVSPFYWGKGNPKGMFHGFHGDGGALMKSKPGYKGKDTIEETKQLIRNKVDVNFKNSHSLIDYLENLFVEADTLAAEIDGSTEKWLDIFYWKNRLQRWGTDVLTVKRVGSWLWTPLVDLSILQAALLMPPEYKKNYQFTEAVTVANSPLMKQVINYTANKALIDRIRRSIKYRLKCHFPGLFSWETIPFHPRSKRLLFGKRLPQRPT